MRDCFRSPLALTVRSCAPAGQALQADVAILRALHDVFALDALGPAEGPAEAGGALSLAAGTALLRPVSLVLGSPLLPAPGVTGSPAAAPSPRPAPAPHCMGGAPNSSLAPRQRGAALNRGRLEGWPRPAPNPQDPGRPLCQFVE